MIDTQTSDMILEVRIHKIGAFSQRCEKI